MYVRKDLFGILVIVSVNDFSEYLGYKNCECKKRWAGKLAEECTENIEETRLVENELNFR